MNPRGIFYKLFHKSKCVFVLMLVIYVQGILMKWIARRRNILYFSLFLSSLFFLNFLFLSVLAWAHTFKIRTNFEIGLHHIDKEKSHIFLQTYTHTRSYEDSYNLTYRNVSLTLFNLCLPISFLLPPPPSLPLNCSL